MNWFNVVQKIVPIVVGAVHAVETIKNIKGKDKQDAAVSAIEAMIPAFQVALPEGVFQSDEFQILLRNLIDSYVAIQNFISKAKK